MSRRRCTCLLAYLFSCLRRVRGNKFVIIVDALHLGSQNIIIILYMRVCTSCGEKKTREPFQFVSIEWLRWLSCQQRWQRNIFDEMNECEGKIYAFIQINRVHVCNKFIALYWVWAVQCSAVQLLMAMKLKHAFTFKRYFMISCLVNKHYKIIIFTNHWLLVVVDMLILD